MCQRVALTNSVHHWRRKQSLWRGCGMRREGRKEARLWDEKRRQEGGQPPCKETADPVLQAEPVKQLQMNLW